MEISPGGDKLYVSLAHKILIIDTSTLEVVGTIDSHGSNGLALSGDGTELWFPDSDKITVYSAADKKVIAELPVGINCPNPEIAFSPDGRLFLAGPAGDKCLTINVYDADKKIKTGEIKLPGFPTGIVYLAR
jgi:DNA-binding beta-propeller fold protein YncE